LPPFEPPPLPPPSLSTARPLLFDELRFFFLAALFFSESEVFFLVESVEPPSLESPEPVLPEPVEPLAGVLFFGAVVEPGLVVSAGAVLSEPSGTMPGFSPELPVTSALALYEPYMTASNAQRIATMTIVDLLDEVPFTIPLVLTQ
jgi:hypothetical protein